MTKRETISEVILFPIRCNNRTDVIFPFIVIEQSAANVYELFTSDLQLKVIFLTLKRVRGFVFRY